MADVTEITDESVAKKKQKEIRKLTELKPESEESIFKLLDLQRR